MQALHRQSLQCSAPSEDKETWGKCNDFGRLAGVCVWVCHTTSVSKSLEIVRNSELTKSLDPSHSNRNMFLFCSLVPYIQLINTTLLKADTRW